ncbi:MAG: hypothetical protein NXH81_13015 [Halieaceae bacterium]|jgi:hypothetical protein|uniref:hypothetical protein n=1 Tax=Haliea alexandrii TaxID=2448162 RepID=UPI000F0B6F14|nr:hypothetical protein [Haliea alexandrii]MCR9186313.1 hypothetical protein [Halieaceae bacterium]
MARLVELQTGLTNALAEVFADAQDRGFVKKNLSPKTAALFMQAYPLGRVLVDIEACTAEDQASWSTSIDWVSNTSLLES